MNNKRTTSNSPEGNKNQSSRSGNKKNPNSTESTESKKRVRSLGEWNDLISQRIEDAAKDGAFDNLPGKGKPQNLNRNPFVPEGNQLAFDLLQNNDLAPGWVMERKGIKHEIEALRRLIKRQTDTHREGGLGTEDRAQHNIIWREMVHDWQETIVALNQRIDTLNLNQPLTQLELLKLRLDEELSRVGATRTEA